MKQERLRTFENDICYEHSGVHFICETRNECNNILVYSTEQQAPFDLIKSVLLFIKTLHEIHHIDYISIYEERPWSIIKRFKTLQDPECPNQHYANISENMESINEVLNR